MEYTFSMIKPDITKRNMVGTVISYLEREGLKIVAQRMLIMSKGMAEKFYLEHKDRSFFKDLIENITAGPVIVQVLKGDGAILKNRKIMGVTNPKDADIGTIRKDLAVSIDLNSIHGSDSKESAAREIAFFFGNIEIVE